MSQRPRRRLATCDDKYGVLVDVGGLLFPFSEIHWLEACIAEHKKHSALELEAIARRLAEELYPEMVNQINWDCFK